MAWQAGICPLIMISKLVLMLLAAGAAAQTCDDNNPSPDHGGVWCSKHHRLLHSRQRRAEDPSTCAVVSFYILTPSSQSTRGPEAVAQLGSAAVANHRAYAKAHGYHHLSVDNVTSPMLRQALAMVHPASWVKLFLVADFLRNPRLASIALYAYLDADVFIARPQWSLSRVLRRTTSSGLWSLERSRAPRGADCSFVFAADVGWNEQARVWLEAHNRADSRGSRQSQAKTPNRLFNAGIFLMRNTPAARQTIELAIEATARDRWQTDWEQQAFVSLYVHRPRVRRAICVVNRTRLQGLVRLDSDQQLIVRGDVWAAHFTGKRYTLAAVNQILKAASAPGGGGGGKPGGGGGGASGGGKRGGGGAGSGGKRGGAIAATAAAAAEQQQREAAEQQHRVTAALAAATVGSDIWALQQTLSNAQGVEGVEKTALIAAIQRLSLLEAQEALRQGGW